MASSYLSSSSQCELIVCVCSVPQLCLTLCSSMYCSPLDSSVPGIFQARIRKWVVISYSEDLPDPGIKPVSLASPTLAGGFFTTVPPGKPMSLYYHHINIPRHMHTAWNFGKFLSVCILSILGYNRKSLTQVMQNFFPWLICPVISCDMVPSGIFCILWITEKLLSFIGGIYVIFIRIKIMLGKKFLSL